MVSSCERNQLRNKLGLQGRDERLMRTNAQATLQASRSRTIKLSVHSAVADGGGDKAMVKGCRGDAEEFDDSDHPVYAAMLQMLRRT